MEEKTFQVQAKITAGAFRNFAAFDALRLRRRWRPPVLFAVILVAFACVCFSLQGRAEQAMLLGGILAAVGLGLPLAYFLSFFLSVRTQVKQLGLKENPKDAYTVQVDRRDGVAVTAGRERASFAWDQVFGAYRKNGCIYLYATAARAFLLPEEQVEGGADALWSLLEEKLPKKQRVDYR